MMSRTLPLSDGATVRLIDAGRGEPLLLIHGVGMRAEAWEPQMAALSAHHHVIAVDMPGHGVSSPLSAAARLPDFVAWAAQLVEALELGPVNLVGHSMGALVAAGLVVERPDLVRRLALLNAVHRRSPEARAAVLARADEIARGEGDNEAPLIRWFGANQVAIRNKVAHWLEGIDPQGYATAYRAFAEGDAVYADRLAEIACPTLVLTGDGDRNSSAQMSHEMANVIPLGRALIVAGHRHMVNMTAPYIVNDALTNWLRWDETNMTPFDPRALRDAFGCFMTGVTVVTTTSEGVPLGFTANSFSSVSLDPPLLLVSIAKTSRNFGHFVNAGHFAINVLAESQKDVSGTFARPVEDRFASVKWSPGPAGSPVFSGVSAWFDCRLSQLVEAGDHAILIGEIKGFAASQEPGLGYYRGAYITPAQTAAQLPTGPDVMIAAIVEAWGEVLLVEDGQGGLALPEARVGREGVQAALTQLLRDIAPDAAPGEIYAVYDGAAPGRQHIAFRCPATSTDARQGRFVPLEPDHLKSVGDPATRSMLDRLAAESRLGNYGVYFGSHIEGQVTHKQGAEA